MTVTPTSASAALEPREEIGRRRLDRDGHGHGRRGGHGRHLLLDPGELGDARDERLELEAREDVAHGLGVHRLHVEVLRADGQLDVAQQAVERAVAADVVEVLAEVAADDAGDLVGVLEQGVERAELPEPLDRGLLAHLRDAGQVVARLADERRDVGVLLGPHAVALDDGRGVVALELRDALHVRVEQRDVVVDELDGVAVARADEHVESLLGALRREGREDVVGLDVLLLQHRDAHRREAVLQDRDLTLELVGRLGAVRLVLACTRGCGTTAARCRTRPPGGSAARP